jgi:hypothetical protein
MSVAFNSLPFTTATNPKTEMASLSLVPGAVRPPPVSRSSSICTLVGDSPLDSLHKDVDVVYGTCEECAAPVPPLIINSDLILDDYQGVDLSLAGVIGPIKALLSATLASADRAPRIVGLLATADKGCHMYARMTGKACTSNGFEFVKVDISSCREQDDDAAFEVVKGQIMDLNEDPAVDGLIVYFPLFGAERVSTV